MDELISIIVPVYNIEQHLKKCINSIISQTYPNFELLLVDDGSTDHSGSICNSFAIEDSRIKVIHKENGGLSDARNVAIPVARGNYILFIDGDDYIDQEYISYLYELQKKTSADIAVCEFNYVNENGTRINHPRNDGIEIVMDQRQSIYELLSTKLYSNSASGKLYKRELFDNIRYPKGRLFEDIATTYRIFLKSNTVIFGAKALYYYVQHSDTISTSTFSEKKLDAVEFVESMTKEIEANYPDLMKICKCRCIDTYVGILKQIDAKEQRKIANTMHQKIRNIRSIVFFKEASLKRKIWAATSIFNTTFYCKLLKHI